MHIRHHATVAAAVGLTLFFQASVAQDLKDTIVGCADVKCPDKENSPTPNCTVVDSNFLSIGLARVPSDIDALEGVSWVQGNSLVERTDDQPLYKKNFYLGTPPDFSFNGTGACALFFGNVSGNVDFDGDDIDLSQGTCAQAMSEGCVSAMISRAEGLDYEGLSSEEACEKLEKEFRDNLDSECDAYGRGGKWLNLTAIPLSGPEGVEPIDSQENSTSNCWPIEPKSYDLSLVKSSQSEGDARAATILEKFARITPILTVFFPNGSGGVVSEVAGQLTCMKVIVNSVKGEENKSDGNENGAGVLVLNLGMLLSVVSASLYLAF